MRPIPHIRRRTTLVVAALAVLAGMVVAWRGEQFLLASLVSDDFTDESKIATTENVVVDTVNGQIRLALEADFTCGEDWTDSRDGKTYATVLIGSQCWMAENLNVGTLVAGSGNQGSDCGSIDKYCYSNNESNCTTYGGLYQWEQAMCGSAAAGAQGICPNGWHIPTHDEWTTLERTVCESGTCTTDFPYNTSTSGWRGTNEGTLLKSGGSSGFEGLLAGYRNTNGSFGYLGSFGIFWSSVESGANAWRRYLGSSESRVYRNAADKLRGFSVRCLKD